MSTSLERMKAQNCTAASSSTATAGAELKTGVSASARSPRSEKQRRKKRKCRPTTHSTESNLLTQSSFTEELAKHKKRRKKRVCSEESRQSQEHGKESTSKDSSNATEEEQPKVTSFAKEAFSLEGDKESWLQNRTELEKSMTQALQYELKLKSDKCKMLQSARSVALAKLKTLPEKTKTIKIPVNDSQGQVTYGLVANMSPEEHLKTYQALRNIIFLQDVSIISICNVQKHALNLIDDTLGAVDKCIMRTACQISQISKLTSRIETVESMAQYNPSYAVYSRHPTDSTSYSGTDDVVLRNFATLPEVLVREGDK